MTTRERIITQAESVFDRYGFAGSGMDQVTAAAEVSTRTLYKHVGSKDALIETVLRERRTRFFARAAASSVNELFAMLEQWIAEEGARGCLFLRAEGENGAQILEISAAVDDYHRLLRDLVAQVVWSEVGTHDSVLTDQVLVLFEGATSAATYRGASIVRAASAAASVLLASRLGDPTRPDPTRPDPTDNRLRPDTCT